MREIHGRDAGSAVGNGDRMHLLCVVLISIRDPGGEYCAAFLRRALNASVDIAAWQV
jgi:hypothetical protein